MKKIINIVLLIFPFSIAIAQTNWDNANNAYAAGQYQETLDLYLDVAARDGVSADLYYNLGNTYFKLNDVAHAIIYYRRALKLNPNHADAKYNLEFARSRTKDKIEMPEQFFLSKWTNKLVGLANSNTWLFISASAFIMALIAFFFFLFGNATVMRKTGFYAALILVLIFIIALIFSIMQYHAETSDSEAVIVVGAVTLKSSPDKTGTDLFVLHEGTEVTIEDQVGEWVYVRLANSDKAWMLVSQLERI